MKSLVTDILQTNHQLKEAIAEALAGRATNGDELVEQHLNPLIDAVFNSIRAALRPTELSLAQAELYITQLSVFARYNSQFLFRAAQSTESSCFELAHELRRNHLEEGGERGRLPAHYVLYTSALLNDLGIFVNGAIPVEETQTLLLLHDLLVESHSLGRICGGYYATEAVAIAETLLLQDITNRYGDVAYGRSGKSLSELAYYYDLHLDENHVYATGGMSVEASHAEGIGRFIRQCSTFGIDLADATDGFLQILEGMSHWWSSLIVRAAQIDSVEAN